MTLKFFGFLVQASLSVGHGNQRQFNCPSVTLIGSRLMVYGVHYVNTISFFSFPPQDFISPRVVGCFSFHLLPFFCCCCCFYKVFLSTHSCPLGSQQFKPRGESQQRIWLGSTVSVALHDGVSYSGLAVFSFWMHFLRLHVLPALFGREHPTEKSRQKSSVLHLYADTVLGLD